MDRLAPGAVFVIIESRYRHPSMEQSAEKGHAEKGLYSGLIRLHILHHAADEGIFGLGMIEELARHGYKLSPGTLYPILHRLEEQGLLRSKSRTEAGKIRRIYYATSVGRKALRGAKEKVRELFGELFERKSSARQRSR
jgi:PadR family transcriptional regulator